METDNLEDLQTRLGVRFQDIERLKRALTHGSAVAEAPLDSNERLEFLGDAVLGLVACEMLMERFPLESEGRLAKAKAYIVSEQALAPVAQKIGIDACLILSPAEDAAGGRQLPSILSDAFEALIAAIYLDQGFAEARRVVRDCLDSAIEDFSEDRHAKDYKTLLQEITQKRRRQIPEYAILEEIGRDHAKTFVASASLDGVFLGRGEGTSKKRAEQAAAQNALESLPSFLLPPQEDAAEDRPAKDRKTQLQELAQKQRRRIPEYETVEETGRDHEKVFVAEARLEGIVLGRGEGTSKKRAEQAAAQNALENPHLLLQAPAPAPE